MLPVNKNFQQAQPVNLFIGQLLSLINLYQHSYESALIETRNAIQMQITNHQINKIL